MNKILLFSTTVITIVALNACTRCKKCSYVTKVAGVDSTVSIKQECGKKSFLEAYENDAKASAVRNNAQGDVTCETVK